MKPIFIILLIAQVLTAKEYDGEEVYDPVMLTPVETKRVCPTSGYDLLDEQIGYSSTSFNCVFNGKLKIAEKQRKEK